MKPLITCIVTIALSWGISAQISFTNQSNLIPSIGFNNFEPCALDMNGDNLDDIIRHTVDGALGEVLVISYQNPDGTFTTEYIPVDFQNTASWSITGADIDKNGFNDLVLGSGNRVSFVYANDNGTAYEEVFIDDYIFAQRSTFMDINNDGHLDSFVCHDVDQSHPYVNDGNGNLTEDQDLIWTEDYGGNYAAIWVDVDNDYDCDLYITKCRGGAPAGDPQRINGLYQNNGDGTFTEVGEAANMNTDDQSWSTVFEDFDNDGDFDAFIVNHAWANMLMDNDGNGVFTDIIGGSNIDVDDLGAWESMGGDFDNDGWVDIFSQVGSGMYKNNGDGTFTDMFAPAGKGAVGDFNNDGFLDYFSGSNVYINDANDNNWVKFTLDGIVSNKNGIGSRINLYGSWGMQTRECRSGQGFSPGHSLNVHFGIGNATEIDYVEIIWPSGTVITIDGPTINQTHVVVEAECVNDDNEVTVTGSTTLCPGESVILTADPGFEYNWSNGTTSQEIEVSESGNYSVILTDGDGCISQSNLISVEVIIDEPPTITLLGDDMFCEGDQAMLLAEGGSNWEWPGTGQTGQTLTVTESGEYYVQADGFCGVIESEAITITVVDTPEDPVATDVTIPTAGTATLEATGNNLYWYDDPLGENEIGQGNTLEVNVTENSVFYVEDVNIVGGELQSGGKPDNSGGGGLPSSGAYSYFNSNEPFTILTVRVYVPETSEAGVRTITLNDEDGNVLESTSVNLDFGEHVIVLNFPVPEATGMSLRCLENNLFRNNSGVEYPYPIGDVGMLYDSFFGGAYYYYFYDWEIEKEKLVCASNLVPVSVFVTGINDLNNSLSVSLSPNPVIDELNIEMVFQQSQDVTLEVRNTLGEVVFKTFVNGIGTQNVRINCSDLAAGNYSLNLYNSSGSYGTHFVKL